ncbi:hypothetical protein CORC01_01854, partial [Colletotrichum orchidophilum]
IHLFAGQISTPIATSPLRPLGSSFKRLVDGFVTWSMHFGEILTISRHLAGTPMARGLRLERSSSSSAHQDQASSRELLP